MKRRPGAMAPRRLKGVSQGGRVANRTRRVCWIKPGHMAKNRQPTPEGTASCTAGAANRHTPQVASKPTGLGAGVAPCVRVPVPPNRALGPSFRVGAEPGRRVETTAVRVGGRAATLSCSRPARWQRAQPQRRRFGRPTARNPAALSRGKGCDQEALIIEGPLPSIPP